jgi:signal transduction histidine kinase/CheY-like chemotaxis protein
MSTMRTVFRQHWRAFTAFAVLYGATYAVSLRLTDTVSTFAPIWPPLGVLVGALLLLPSISPLTLFGIAFVVGRFASPNGIVPPVDRLALILLGFAEAYLCARLLVRWCGPTLRFSRLGDVLALVSSTLIAVTANSLLSGVVAVLTDRPFVSDFVASWVAGVLGILLVTPLMVAWLRGPDDLEPGRNLGRMVGEGVVLALLLVAQAVWVFRGAELLESASLPAYSLLVTLLWVALRFGVRGVTTATTLITTMAFIAVVFWESSALGGRTLSERLFVVQLYVAFMTVYGLLLAVALGERRAASQAEQAAIEARLQSERRLQESQKMQAVGILAGGVAHDFNNVLTIIASFVQALRHTVSDEERTRFTNEALDAVDRGHVLTANLLALGRLESVTSKRVDIDDEIQRLEPMMRRLMGSRVDVRLSLASKSISELPASAITQVLLNLGANARDAMPEGGTLTIRTTRATSSALGAGGNHVLLEVMDTGTGMDAATMQRAFEPYFTTKPVGKGTGFGLAGVYGLMQVVGGDVTLDSVLGRGTTVRVRLPIPPDSVDTDEAPAMAPAVATATPSTSSSATASESVRVLLVDDDTAVRRALAAMLKRNGIQVREATSAAEVIEFDQNGELACDILLSDVRMPGMDGVELALVMRSRQPQLPILLMSGFVEDAQQLARLEDTDIPLLAKPIRADALLSTINDLIRRPA